MLRRNERRRGPLVKVAGAAAPVPTNSATPARLSSRCAPLIVRGTIALLAVEALPLERTSRLLEQPTISTTLR